MANPKKIVQPSDLPIRKSHSQVVAVTGGTLVFVARHDIPERERCHTGSSR